MFKHLKKKAVFHSSNSFISVQVLFQEKGEVFIPAEVPIFEVQFIYYAILFLIVLENEGKTFDRAERRVWNGVRSVFILNSNALKGLFGCLDSFVSILPFDFAIILAKLTNECT